MNSKAYKSYEIGKNEYLELKYFCLQYPEMVKAIEKRDWTDRYWSCIKNVVKIDNALNRATDNEVIRAYLRRSVIENVKFENLDVPMGRQQFYELRRKFFYILKTLKMG